MTTDKPPVIIIRTKDDPISEKLSKETRESWEKHGYVTEFFDAIKPDELDQYNYIDFGNEILPHKNRYRNKKIKKLGLVIKHPYEPAMSDSGVKYSRVISPTAKCIYYSHIEVWKLVSKRNTPHLVVEHDMVLRHELPKNLFKRFHFYQLGDGVCHCSYITPLIINKLLKRVEKYTPTESVALSDKVVQRGLLNIDGFLWRLLINIVYTDQSLQNKMYFFIGKVAKRLDHIKDNNQCLYTDVYGNMIRDISKTKDGRDIVYETVAHEILIVD